MWGKLFGLKQTKFLLTVACSVIDDHILIKKINNILVMPMNEEIYQLEPEFYISDTFLVKN